MFPQSVVVNVVDVVAQVWDVFIGLWALDETSKESRPGQPRSTVAHTLPLLFSVVLMCILREPILKMDFGQVVNFLTTLPCDLEDAVRRTLIAMPLVFRIMPRAVIASVGSDIDVHHRSIDEHLQQLKTERAPRIEVEDAFSGPVFDKCLIIDTRSPDEYARNVLWVHSTPADKPRNSISIYPRPENADAGAKCGRR